ncbi:9109_t:CDS:2, partial [Gigaspora rosea]
RDNIHHKKLLDSEVDAVSISSINNDNKRKPSIMIEARNVHFTTLIDCSHSTSVDLPSITSESIVINTDSPNSYPYQTTPLSFRTSYSPSPTSTSILSESPCITLKPSTVIPIPSLRTTDQTITQSRSPHHLNGSVRTKDYPDSSPFDYEIIDKKYLPVIRTTSINCIDFDHSKVVIKPILSILITQKCIKKSLNQNVVSLDIL